MPLDLTVIILTKNESIHMERVLENVRAFASRIVVVDSFSDDDTVAISRSNGADVFQNKFTNQARQFQWALDNVAISTEWIMRLDADELVEDDLMLELERTLPHLSREVVGINLNRKHIFLGRWIRHGGRYPLSLLRIWRAGHGKVEDKWMDEHIHIFGGRAISMKGGFADHNLNDLAFFTAKHNSYATREAVEVLTRELGLSPKKDSLQAHSASQQAAVKRFIKERVYNRIPFPAASLLYFLWRYIFQLGFLDGREGLVYHFLQGYWYRFLVGARLLEIRSLLGDAKTPEQYRDKISSLTGLNVR